MPAEEFALQLIEILITLVLAVLGFFLTENFRRQVKQKSADLEIYGSLYFEDLHAEDKAFLTYCGENRRKKPWRGS